MEKEIKVKLTDAAYSTLKEEAEKHGKDVSDIAKLIINEWAVKHSIKCSNN